MMSIWDAPSDRDVLSAPYDPAIDDEEPQPEMAMDEPQAVGWMTDEECSF